MRIFIAGVDGYLGWALSQYLTARGHEVAGADNFARRSWVDEMSSGSATPVRPMAERLEAFAGHYGRPLTFYEGDLQDYEFTERIFREFQPEATVHLAECPSAPYSMIDVGHATYVQMNNIVTTFNLLFATRDITPDAHMVKLGTMGEYGTPNVDIPEGFFEIEYRGRKDRLPFPRQAGSWYHWSKVHDSNNIMFACRLWGLRSTDIMQGVVYGTRFDGMGADEALMSRLDFDQAFGTAINRFCCTAVIGEPLTVYGKGSQKRGFLPLRDSMQCLTLALENPPDTGEYRVFNQFEEVYDINGLARKVQSVAADMGMKVEIQSLENPRMEMEDHHYNPDHQHLLDLGYKPTRDMEGEIRQMLTDLSAHRGRIEKHRDALIPDIRWRGDRRKSRMIVEAR